MANIHQIRGMLLEEALLYLLRRSGYKTIDAPGDDPTLRQGRAGLEVIGRGSVHQIDAIADYTVAHPFSHPQRLLVEAKFKRENIGLEILRNAVGVLTDVNEYWVSSRWNNARNVHLNNQDEPVKNRYHYQYAMFSSSKYSPESETYAFAHDIYLIPLARSRFMEPILNAIGQLKKESFGNANADNNIRVEMTNLRRAIRSALRDGNRGLLYEVGLAEEAFNQLNTFLDRTRRINEAILGMIANQLPVFLVSSPNENLNELQNEYQVRIRWDQDGWYLRDSRTDLALFSFDLPQILFDRYAENGVLTRTAALDLKQENLGNIQAIVTSGETTRVITFRLDGDWIQELRRPNN